VVSFQSLSSGFLDESTTPHESTTPNSESPRRFDLDPRVPFGGTPWLLWKGKVWWVGSEMNGCHRVGSLRKIFGYSNSIQIIKKKNAVKYIFSDFFASINEMPFLGTHGDVFELLQHLNLESIDFNRMNTFLPQVSPLQGPYSSSTWVTHDISHELPSILPWLGKSMDRASHQHGDDVHPPKHKTAKKVCCFQEISDPSTWGSDNP